MKQAAVTLEQLGDTFALAFAKKRKVFVAYSDETFGVFFEHSRILKKRGARRFARLIPASPRTGDVGNVFFRQND